MILKTASIGPLAGFSLPGASEAGFWLAGLACGPVAEGRHQNLCAAHDVQQLRQYGFAAGYFGFWPRGPARSSDVVFGQQYFPLFPGHLDDVAYRAHYHPVARAGDVGFDCWPGGQLAEYSGLGAAAFRGQDDGRCGHSLAVVFAGCAFNTG